MDTEGKLNQCIPEPQIAYGEGISKDPTSAITPAENNSEKAVVERALRSLW